MYKMILRNQTSKTRNEILKLVNNTEVVALHKGQTTMFVYQDTVSKGRFLLHLRYYQEKKARRYSLDDRG